MLHLLAPMLVILRLQINNFSVLWLCWELVLWGFGSPDIDRWIWLYILLWNPSYILMLYILRGLSAVQYQFLLIVVFLFFVISNFIQFLVTIFWYLRFFNYVNYLLFFIFFMLLNVLILFLKILILDKLNMIWLILFIRTISLFDNLNPNIIRSKTFFHIIWALLNNLIIL